MSNLERIAYMDRAARERGGFTIAEIARRFEVGERQVRRDIDYLRDRLDAPLEWDAVSHRYTYTSTYTHLKFTDEKSLLFLVFARAAAEALAYVPLAEPHSLEALRAAVPAHLRGLESNVRYELPEQELSDDETLALILAAINDKRSLDFDYRDARSRKSHRSAIPRRLVNYAGTWYLAAYDLGRRELRTFKLSRAASFARGERHDDHGPAEEEVDRFLDSSYGMFKGPASRLARARFYARAREIVRSELWHPDQERSEGTEPDRGPYIELAVPVSSYDEILGRILRFGADARVVGPEEFVTLWKEEIRRMAEAANGA
jgi:predicted DNA-binding transcriptional regulator YafY